MNKKYHAKLGAEYKKTLKRWNKDDPSVHGK